jgi:hypothetical protein
MNIMPNSGFFATHFKRIALPFHTVMQNPGMENFIKPPSHAGIGVDQPSGGVGAGPLPPVVNPQVSSTSTQVKQSGFLGGALSNLFRMNQE